MILLTDPAHKLDLVPATAGALDVVASFLDIGAGNLFLPGSQEAQLTATGDIVDAPASGVARQLKHLSIVNVDGQIGNTVVVRKHDGVGQRRVSPSFFLRPRSSLQYTDREGWKLLTDQNPGVRHTLAHSQSSHDTSGSKSLNQGAFEGLCLGAAPFAASSVTAQFRVATLAAGIIWAEAFLFASSALYPSEAEYFGRVLGYVDISGLLGSTGPKTATVPFMLPVRPGEKVWLCFASRATSGPLYRTGTAAIANDLGPSETITGAIGQPSLSLGRIVRASNLGVAAIGCGRYWR